jgi:hypothetical protein
LLLFSIGLPGRFAEWCDSTIARLAAERADDVLVRQCPSTADLFRFDRAPPLLDEVALGLIGSSARHLVMAVRQPDLSLRTALSQANARFVVSLTAPRRVAADLLSDAGAEPKMVARAVANICASTLPLLQLPGALLLRPDDVEADVAGAVRVMADHLGLPAKDDAVASAVAAFPQERSAFSADDDDWPDTIPEDARGMLRGPLSGYDQFLAGRGLGQLTWNRDLFVAVDPDKQATDILDLAGGARILVYGPYIRLPPGSWTAQVYIGLSPEAAGHTLLIDVYAGGELAAASLQPAAGGIFVTEVSFALDEACEHPVEVRVVVTQHDAKGRLAFGRVVLQPQAMRRPDAIAELADFSAALDL